MVWGLAVLLIVAAQEEVVYRGYVTLNLLTLGPGTVIVVSTSLFVLIHFLTNRVNVYQIASWVISGLVLVIAYLTSGSIWVPIFIHFAIDATNVLVFNITGQFSLFAFSPALTERQRVGYCLVYGLTTLAAILAFYGMSVKLV